MFDSRLERENFCWISRLENKRKWKDEEDEISINSSWSK